MEGRSIVRVLGPIDAVTAEGPMVVRGHGQRCVLGVLALRAGRAVPIDELVAALWGDAPPPTAANIVQSYVSRLRRLLGVDAIVLAGHSYRLDGDRVDVDASVFEGLVRRAHEVGEPGERLALVRASLDLWRGRPFGDFADEEPFVLEAHRLDSLRDAAMELGVEAEIRLGRHELVVGELEAAVREHPFNERWWYLLIEALALAERRVEALRACAEVRRRLGEAGLGVEERIACLERLVLDGAPITIAIADDACG